MTPKPRDMKLYEKAKIKFIKNTQNIVRIEVVY